MSALSRTEIRTYHDLQAQADLERMLAKRRDAEAARAARFAAKRADETNTARWDLVYALIFSVAATALMAALAAWVLPIMWRLP